MLPLALVSSLLHGLLGQWVHSVCYLVHTKTPKPYFQLLMRHISTWMGCLEIFQNPNPQSHVPAVHFPCDSPRTPWAPSGHCGHCLCGFPALHNQEFLEGRGQAFLSFGTRLSTIISTKNHFFEQMNTIH